MLRFTKSILIASLFILLYSVNGYSQWNINVSIYEDLNGNGTLDGGDPNIAVTPTLWEDPDMDLIFTPSAIFFNGTAFPNVTNGNYEVRYPATSGTYIRLTPASGVHTVVMASADVNLAAGYYQAATMGDFVWNDLNGNGIQNGGEPGLSITVNLNGTTGLGAPVSLSTASNGAGAYSFGSLQPGIYTVSFVLPSANHFFSVMDATGDDTQDSDANQATGDAPPFNLMSNDYITHIDAGIYIGATIGDFVWHDLNGNGIQDGGEPGLAGISVNLNGTNGAGMPVSLGPILTNGTGNYTFMSLAPGTYNISFVLPSANHFFSVMDATVDTQDSDPNPMTGIAPPVTVISDEDITDLDAGIYIGATIGDFVWHDLNGNGIQDGGEPGLAGISVNLNGTNGAGMPVSLGPILTNGTGNYTFMSLAPGTYNISFVLPSANHFFSVMDATVDIQDSDPNPMTGIAPAVPVISDEDVTHIDAGIFQGATISDYTWEDMNGNGTQDGGEPPLGGVMISITTSGGGPVIKADGTPAIPVFSTGAGAYLFDRLVPGDYILNFAANVAGYYRTIQGVGGAAVDSDPNQMTGLTNIVNVVSAQIVTNIDAGYYRAGEIGDFTWIDFNGDGLQNDPSPLGGVSIAITDNLGAGVMDVFGAPIGPVNSGGGGNYSFPNLKPGMYKLTFTAPGGYFPTRLNAAGGATQAADVGNDSDVDQGAGNMSYIITIASGQMEARVDGGFYQPVTIGNFVWHDANADGIQDAGELGENGVTITLTNSDGSPLTNVNNAGIAPAVTAGGGMYQFMNVRPGLYNIAVTAPPMWFFSDPDATGDNADSDFTMAGNLVASLQINSNEINNDVDAGIYKNIIVIGTVWVEQDDNGMQGGGEMGALGVTVQIFTDPGMVLSGTNVTNAMGNYMFSVKPGDYIISVATGNFGAGNPLNGLESCTPTFDPNNDVDLDDNGAGPPSGPIVTTQINFRCGEEPNPDGVTNETIDFCFKFNCGAANTLSAPSCETVVDTFCNLTILDAGCATMPSPPLVGPAPNPLCNGGGAPHNMSWFAFIAGTGNYNIEIVPYGCLPGSGGQLGIQAGIYTDCSFSTSIFCMNTCTTNNIIIPSDNLIPGNTYYFWFDGCAGSVCSYEINVNGDFSEYIIPEPTEVVCASGTCTPVCPGTDITLQVNSGYENATLKFNWKITTPSGAMIFVEKPNNTLDYEVTELGTYIFEIIDIRNKCNRTSTIRSFEVVVRHPDDEDFGLVSLCENFIPGWAGPNADMNGNSDPNGDGIGGWQQFPYTFTEGVNTVTIMQDGCIYDQMVELEELEINPAFNLDLVLCVDEVPYTISANFPTVFGPMPETLITLLGGQTNGCDSLVNLTVTVLETLFGQVDNEGCIDGKTKFRLNNASILNFPVVTTIRWRNNTTGALVNDGNPDFDDFTILIINEGMYTCEIVMTLGNKTCITEIPFDLSLNTLEPPVGVNWPLLFCATTTQSVYVAQSNLPNPSFVWTYPAGTIVTGEGTNTLTVNWNGVSGGEICVSVADDCGESEQYCQTVVITPIPTASFKVDSLICIDSTSSVIFKLPSVAGTTYNWNLGGGLVISGPGSNGNDSLEVMWPDPGKKYITLQITRNGCVSPLVRDSVTVVGLVSPPAIGCTPGSTQIEFFWTAIPGQTGAAVVVTTGQSGIQFGNSYIVSGLLPGATVDLQVTFMSNHPCGNVISTGSCITQNCTPEMVTFDSIPPICLSPTSPTIDLKNFVTTQTPGGVYTFTGPGVNTLTGFFDPKIAGVGTHQLRFVYKDLLGCTSSAAFTNVVVNAIPTSTFTATSVICQDSTSLINYTGSITSGGTFTWNFDGGTVVTGSGVGPYTVRWNTQGSKTISLTAARNGCTSTPTTFNVTVEPRIEPVVITCPTIGSTVLTFDWNDVLNTSDYSLTLNGMALPNSMTSMLSLNTLMVNTNYTLIVRANSNNSCPGKTSTLVCKTLDCPPISIKFSQKDTTICFGNNLPNIDIDATITGGLQSPNQTIVWSGPGVNPTTGVFNPNVAGVGTHNIMFSLTDGSCKKDTSMRITIIAKPVSTFTGLSKICITDNYIVDFTGTTNLPLNWGLQTGVTSAPAGTGKYKITFPKDGTYMIGLTVGNAGCISDLTFLNVVVEPTLDTVKITCQQTTSSVTFNWNDIDCASQYRVEINSVPRGTQSTLTYLSSGLMVGEKVEIKIIPISECACPAIATTKVCEAKQCPNISLKLTSPVPSFCAGSNSTPFQMVSTVTGTGGTGTGKWSGANVTSTGMFNPVGVAAGTYKMFFDFTEESCDFRDSISITIFPVPDLTATSTQPSCYSANFGTANFTTTGGTPAFTYTLNGAASTPPLNNVAPGSYQVIVSDLNKCKDTTSFTIAGVTEPSLTLSGNTSIINGNSTELTATISGLSAQIDSIVWKDLAGNVICSGPSCLKVSVSPKADERYCVTLFYNNGCNVDECINVKVQTIVDIIFPNIISVGGNNPSFYVPGYPNFVMVKSMQIFDRWGNLVFSKENVAPGDKSQGWDGKLNSSPAVPGVYVYKIDVELLDGKSELFVGDITVF